MTRIRGVGRPRKSGNEQLPTGVYRRVRNGKERFYDAEGRALGSTLPIAPRIAPGRKDGYEQDAHVEIKGQKFRLKNERGILSSAIPIEKKSGVYFLICEGKIVYIGMTTHYLKRIMTHAINKKEFDAVAFIEADPSIISPLEAAYIRKFRPPLNIKAAKADAYKRSKKVGRSAKIVQPVVRVYKTGN